MDAATMNRCNSALGKVQLSTLCVKHGLVAAGGFNGELLLRRLTDQDLLCGCVDAVDALFVALVLVAPSRSPEYCF